MDMIISTPANRTKTGKMSSTVFKPGQSGNKSGRPKRTPEEFELIAACKLKAPAALIVIAKLMDESKSDSVKLSAATAIIDRAYGKPTTVIDAKIGSHEVSLRDLA